MRRIIAEPFLWVGAAILIVGMLLRHGLRKTEKKVAALARAE